MVIKEGEVISTDDNGGRWRYYQVGSLSLKEQKMIKKQDKGKGLTEEEIKKILEDLK